MLIVQQVLKFWSFEAYIPNLSFLACLEPFEKVPGGGGGGGG